MDTAAVLELLQEAAATAIDPRFRALEAAEVDEKGPGDLVTDADREAEQIIGARLQAAYPDALVLGEEATATDGALLERYAAAEHAFTLDPVDGTKNFVHGSPDHAVMVAEVRAGVVVRAWIWQPQHGRAYIAEKGAGAFCTGERLTAPVSSSDPTTWTVSASRHSWVGRALPGVAPAVLTWASCGIDYPRLVEGAADVLLYRSTMPWDHAPGSLILTEAGGEHRTPDGALYDPRRVHTGGLVATRDAAALDVVLAGWPATASWR